LHRPEDAEVTYEEALALRRPLDDARPDVYLPDVAMTLNNLGNAQRALNRLKDAQASYQEALTVRRRLAEALPEVFLPAVAITLNCLGNVQSALNQLKDAEASYREADSLSDTPHVRFGTTRLTERLELYSNYVELVMREHPDLGWPDHATARRLLGKAAHCAELYRGLFGDPRERIRVQEELRGLFVQRVRVCLELGHMCSDPGAFAEALEAAETSRSRALLDALAAEITPANAPLELKGEFVRLRRELRRAQRRLHQEIETEAALTRLAQRNRPEALPEVELKPEDGNARSARELTTARRLRDAQLASELAGLPEQSMRIEHLERYIRDRRQPYLSCCDRLRQSDPSFRPDQAATSFQLAQRVALFPNDRHTAFIHLEILAKHSYAMVLTRDGLHPSPLPRLDNDRLQAVVNFLAGAQHVINGEMGTTMNAVITDTVAWLHDALLTPLLPLLAQAGVQRGHRLVFVPDGEMNFLPLHAIPVAADETLGDRYEVSYTPSLSILEQCVRRRRPMPNRLFAAINPLRDLFYTNLEATLVQQHFSDVERLDENKVTRDAFLRGAAQAHVCFYSGHAQFQIPVPLWSGMVLSMTGEREVVVKEHGTRVRKKRPAVRAPHDLLTVMDIDTGLQMPECTLAVLSGCQSGLALPGRGNEVVSLVAAFLNAGAKCVLASLWPVNDLACMLTVDRFFRAWRQEQQTIAVALQTAQRWLRNLTAGELLDFTQGLAGRGIGKTFLTRPTAFAEGLVRDHGREHRPFATLFYWAPFVAVGQAYPETGAAG
jgi:CHAT domain-containing protein